jgi:hypothetical protein
VTFVRLEPSGRILSSRAVKQPFNAWATVNRIQSSLDQAKSYQRWSSAAPPGPPTKRRSEPSAPIVQSSSPRYEPKTMRLPSGDQAGW